MSQSGKRLFDVVAVGAVSAVVCFLLMLGRLTVPVLPPLPAVEALVVIVTIGLIAGSAILRRLWRDGLPEQPPAMAARWHLLARFAVGSIAAFVILALLYSIFGPSQEVPPGAPQIIDGAYYSNNHGDLTPLSKSDYWHAAKIWDMRFLSIGLLLNSINLWQVSRFGRNSHCPVN